MTKARDRADRTGSDPIRVGNTVLETDSNNDLVVKDTGNVNRKVIASEVHLGTGTDKVILKRSSTDGKLQLQTTDGSTTSNSEVSGDSGGSGGVIVQEEGSALSTTATTLNFVGSSVTASGSGSIKTINISAGSGGTTSVYANIAAMTATSPSAGDQALVTANSGLYVYNGNGWYKVATVNTSPTISSPSTGGSFTLALDGTATTIELVGADVDEGTTLQHSYAVTTGSLTNGGGATATVSTSSTSNGTYSALNPSTNTTNRFFKVTPTTNTSYEGSFTLTFSVSDGINAATTVQSFSLQFATYGSAFFDGTDDYVTVANSSQFALGTGDFTIECWVKFSESSLEGSANRRIFSLHNSSGNAVDKLQICIDDGSYRTNGDLFLYSNSDQGYLGVDIRHEWHHIAVVRNSGTLKFYLDGVEKSSNSNTQDYSPGSGTPIPILGSRGDKADYKGYISNFRLVVGTAVYTSNFTVPTSPLSAITNTKLLTAHKNAQISDGSSFNHTITKVGNATEHASSPFPGDTVGYGSLYFDGTQDYVTVNSSTDFDFGTGAFTVECWYQPKFDTAGSSMIMLYDIGSNHVRVRFKSGSIRAQLGSETQILYNISGSSLDQTTWYHSALTRDGTGNVKLFHNGSVVGSYGGSTYNVGSTSLRIGNINLATSGYRFTGYISNFRVVKGTAVYTSGFTPSTSPLTAVTNTKLLTAQRSTPLNVTSGSIHLNGGRLQTTSSDFTLGTGDFTIETWFKYGISALSDNDYLIDLESGKLQFYFTGGEIVARIGGSNTYTVRYDLVADLEGNLNTNRFYHLALVRNGSNTTIFLDGIQKANQNSSAFNHTGTSLTIGSHVNGNYQWYGYITDFRIVKGRAVYTGEFTPPSGALTKTGGTYPSSTNISNPTASETVLLIGNNSSTITDISDSSHSLTPYNSVSASSVVATKIVTDQSSANQNVVPNANTRNAVNWPFNYNG